MLRVTRQIQAPQTQGAHRQCNTTHGAQYFGQAEEVIGRRPIKSIVIHRGNAGGCKAQHEAVKREVVHAFARQRECVVFVVATITMAAAQVLQTQGIVRCFSRCGRAQRRTAGGRRDFAPKLDHTQSQRQNRPQENGCKHAHHEVVREDGIKTIFNRATPQRAIALNGQDQKQTQAEGQGH